MHAVHIETYWNLQKLTTIQICVHKISISNKKLIEKRLVIANTLIIDDDKKKIKVITEVLYYCQTWLEKCI